MFRGGRYGFSRSSVSPASARPALTKGFVQDGGLPFIRRLDQEIGIQTQLQWLARVPQRRIVRQERRGTHHCNPVRMDQRRDGLDDVSQ